MKIAHNRIDITGQTYNSWEVLSYNKTVGKVVYYNAKCKECNDIYVVDGRNIRLGLSKRCTSCGRKKSALSRTGKMRKGQDPVLFAYKRLFKNYRMGARDRKLQFDMSLQNFIDMSKMDCTYCGSEPCTTVNALTGMSLSTEKQNLGWITYNGVDRIDSTKGYIDGNMTTCCKKCNRLKSNSSEEEFFNWVSKCYHHLKAKGKL